MSIITIVSIFSLMLSLYIGLNILFIDKKSETNRLFFFMCLSLAFFIFCSLFITSAKENEYLSLWLKCGIIGILFFYSFLLHFCLVISKIIKIKNFYYLFLYLPTIILVLGISFLPFIYRDFIKGKDQLAFIFSIGLPWLVFYLIYITLYSLSTYLILYLWYKKSKFIKHKRQSIILLIGICSINLINLVEAMILPLFTSYKSLGISPITVMILTLGIWYSITKYKFLSITPELVSKDLIENIDESVILLNDSFNIIKINPATEKLINLKSEDIKSSPISEIISEHKSITDEINNMIKEDHKTFSSRIHYITGNNKNILMDIKFYVIKDKYNDLIGIMLIGKEVKELKQFRSKYKITKRQEEIIRMIINGKLNKEIAQSIGVAESTLKGHISNIYNKLGVTNKIELFNLLKKFNLIPEQPSDKNLLLLKRE